MFPQRGKDHVQSLVGRLNWQMQNEDAFTIDVVLVTGMKYTDLAVYNVFADSVEVESEYENSRLVLNVAHIVELTITVH